ncbi:MAG: 2-oxoisovalerate dehydrogenase, E1 component beta subunit [Candidatus Falkowbacteria bacterium GW2011_GWA2_41_14]|uniref:2-oxoisovalerate dehydrogenase, E1 component beta subunit n=1 Tax=Candidatus Falkowbacteria bacterium GW2011_GWA2_41_14 TaxID=1618635 RepID=A0A0G0UV60_9BACT|nr:MAG: 2-oxoisovalerate dehydrogenase, E1 component beta subunit [Candidatus Falkowbacteria bacterium GW2011_GWA2_41_14]
MKCPNIIQFFIQTAEESGYVAQAVGFSIYTEGETLDETVRNIKEATNCHFGKKEDCARSLPIMINFALPVAV